MILKKDESFPVRPVVIVLYGTPGSGKTSLANTSELPILIDCDRGSDRACNRAESTIIASTWDDVLSDEHEVKNHKTAIFDTAKAVLDDFLMIHVVNKDIKLKTNKLKAYGAIGDEFKSFVNKRRAENIDIVIVAHSKEEKDDDVLKISPDVTGQSKDLILRIADQVGFVSIINGKRTLTFEPTHKIIGKNVARIGTVDIPDESDPKFKTFMADIITKVKQSIQKQSKEQVESQKLIADFTKMINDCNDSDGLMGVSDKCKELPKHLQAGMRKIITIRIDELGLKYDAKENKFVQK